VPGPITPQRALLAQRLRDLRKAAFRSGSALARRLNADHPDDSWHQTRVSKLERGLQRPTERDITQWVAATGASVQELDELLELLAAARVEYATFGQLYRRAGGPVADQRSAAAADAKTMRIAEYQPAMVPGLVQTAAYARELLSLPCGPSSAGASAEDIEAIVGQRIKRQEVLYQPGKKIQLVIGEAALRIRFGTTETLLGQLDRLVAVTGLCGVELGVLPFAKPLPVFPLTNFVLYDEAVLIESITGQQRLDGADEVALYERFFDQLREAAATGPDAVELIQRIAAELRG
jgi:transcriptional regulator with XRE-family HTH domain